MKISVPILFLWIAAKVIKGIKPSLRVPVNEEAESAYLEFEAKEGEPVRIAFTAEAVSDNRVVLNGIEIDGSDPKHKARVPSPPDGDWHADGDSGQIQLGWHPAPSAVKHRVYVSVDDNAARAEALLENAERRFRAIARKHT